MANIVKELDKERKFFQKQYSFIFKKYAYSVHEIIKLKINELSFF